MQRGGAILFLLEFPSGGIGIIGTLTGGSGTILVQGTDYIGNFLLGDYVVEQLLSRSSNPDLRDSNRGGGFTDPRCVQQLFAGTVNASDGATLLGSFSEAGNSVCMGLVLETALPFSSG